MDLSCMAYRNRLDIFSKTSGNKRFLYHHMFEFVGLIQLHNNRHHFDMNFLPPKIESHRYTTYVLHKMCLQFHQQKQTIHHL